MTNLIHPYGPAPIHVDFATAIYHAGGKREIYKHFGTTSCLIHQPIILVSVSVLNIREDRMFRICSNVQTVVPIKKDNDVAWYLAFAKDATNRHPLVAHVSVNCLRTSSSSSNIRENVDMSLNITKNNFQFRTTTSNLRSLEFRCLQECCKWYVRASCYKKSDIWMLRKYTSNHDCSLSIAQSSHMQAFSILIANCLIDDFRFMSTDRSIPKEIVHKARTNLGVNISYQKAWREKEHMIKILYGDTVESYALILRFFDKLVESNPLLVLRSGLGHIHVDEALGKHEGLLFIIFLKQTLKKKNPSCPRRRYPSPIDDRRVSLLIFVQVVRPPSQASPRRRQVGSFRHFQTTTSITDRCHHHPRVVRSRHLHR
uniref:MuDR family transposase n=1 Tax=Cucumis melo TaxID=3656 RepID=A0A9I9EG24_CUCME